jgi:predicted O-methyltransferase YrrM
MTSPSEPTVYPFYPMLVPTLLTLVVLLTIFGAVMAHNVRRLERPKRQQGLGKPWFLQRVSVEELEPAFRMDELGPTQATEVAYIGRGGFPVPGGTSDFETWILCVLARRSTAMFEFGTCTGKTAYLWARNIPAGGRVVTLTLSPDSIKEYLNVAGDDDEAARYALEESRFTRYLYTGTDVESRITQLYGDSKAFDDGPHRRQYDVIFVDGSHALSYIYNDTEKALRMVKPGGVILWHDYAGPHRSPDVHRALNEMAARLNNLRHIKGTTLVFHRAPVA